MKFGPTFISMFAILTLIEVKRHSAHAALLDICASFGLISSGTGNHPGSILGEFKIGKNRINIFPGKISSDKLHVF